MRSWKIAERVQVSMESGRLHDGTFNDLAEGDVFPERDKQLAREGNDRCLLAPATIGFDPCHKPPRQGAVRLMAHPEPRKLDQRGARDSKQPRGFLKTHWANHRLTIKAYNRHQKSSRVFQKPDYTPTLADHARREVRRLSIDRRYKANPLPARQPFSITLTPSC